MCGLLHCFYWLIQDLLLWCNHAEGRVGVKRKLWREMAGRLWFLLKAISFFMENGQRCGLIAQETKGTGAVCSSEKLEKSTAIQVNLTHQFNRFRCSHRPPRARRQFRKVSPAAGGNQVQSVQNATLYSQQRKFIEQQKHRRLQSWIQGQSICR